MRRLNVPLLTSLLKANTHLNGHWTDIPRRSPSSLIQVVVQTLPLGKTILLLQTGTQESFLAATMILLAIYGVWLNCNLGPSGQRSTAVVFHEWLKVFLKSEQGFFVCTQY